MSRHDKLFYSKLLLLFLGIVSLLVFFYTIKLRDVIEQNILSNINEIAQHDKRAIRTCIELFLDELSGVEKRLAAQGDGSLRELETRLNLESATTPFKRLFMLAEDGRIFTDKFLIYTPGQGGIGGRFDFRHLFAGNGRNELVLRFDDNAEFAGISRESILYAIRLENFRVAGLRMTALIGFTDISFLQEHLIIEGFVKNGQAYGFSSVIDMNGNYIVGRTRDIYLRNDTNFFTQLATSRSSSLTKREIISKMDRREDFSLYLEDGDGKKLVYFVPFTNQAGPHLDWYFLMMVNNDFLVARQATFSLMGLSLLALVVLVLTLLMLYGIFSRNRLHMANESVRVRSEFLSNMSHEIRTPLNGLIGLNHLVASHVEERDKLPQIRDWLNKSRSLAEYLLSLLNDILDMSKLQAGRIDIVNARFSITDMIADVIFMQTANAEKNGLRLSLEQDVPAPWVLGDETRLKQILINIIGNAAKFTPSGGSITVSVRQERTDERHVRTVYRCRDTGRGMSKAFLQKLFDPFTQDEQAQRHAALKGTGLGMPITRELVRAMGGAIEVESEEGVGSTFTVVIPSEIAEPEAGAPEAGPDAAPPPALVSREGKILLAEDAEFNAEFLMEVLTDEGFSVVHAENGQVALDIFSASAVDEFAVILMDMQMPVMDGCEAAAAIRALDRPDAATVLIYACTANTFKEDMDKALASGMNDFLTKPIDIKVFLRKMAAISGAPAGDADRRRP